MIGLALAIGFIGVVEIFKGISNPENALKFPFLVSLVWLLWILPQALGIYQNQDASEELLFRTFAMTLLCLICCIWGFHAAKSRRIDFVKSIDFGKLKWYAIGSIIFGAFFHVMLRNMGDELESTNWSGKTVAYLFLSQPLFYGGILAISLYLRKSDSVLLITGLMALGVVLLVALVGGRRGGMIQFVFATICVLYFVRSYLIPRALIILSIPVAAIFDNGIGIYRSAVYEGTTTAENFSISESFRRVGTGLDAVAERYDELLIPKDYYEVLNATMLMESADNSGIMDFGTDLWDHLVHQFFPGQLFGYENKKSLQFQWYTMAMINSNHQVASGSTMTGMFDAYLSFRWFGGIKFFLIGFVMRIFWNSASNGDLLGQIAYGCLVRASLEGVTHSTSQFFMAVINFMLLFGLGVCVISWIHAKTVKGY